MKEFWNTIQVVFTAVGGWLGYFLGGYDGLLYALVVFMIADYITGVMCAAADKKLSSEVGFKGICRKEKFLKQRSKRPVSDYNSDEMEECTDAYAEFVMEQYEEAKKSCKDPVILIEQKLDFSCYVQEGFGTGDCIIISDEKLHIIDFKYGQGILVEAEHNPQMMLYALGALEIYDALYDIKEVSMTIFQPRRENVSTWTIPIEELKA